MEEKLMQGNFDLEDFLNQMQEVKKIGSLESILGMIPGGNKLMQGGAMPAVDEKQMARVEAIIRSMTPKERRDPELINGSRKRRIASGSGTSTQEVNRLLGQFRDMRKMMRQMSQMANGKMPGGKMGKMPKGAMPRGPMRLPRGFNPKTMG
jgi:signal recognition particle subunit SRP54